jgi:hypothetical protein
MKHIRLSICSWSGRLVLLALMVTVGALGASARTYGGSAPAWNGDFESGNLGQWDAVQQVGDRVTLERAIVRQGRYAARFEVKPGDRWAGLGGERAEVLKSVGEVEGGESYWAWSTYFPRTFVSDPTAGFQMFTQWHSTSNTNNSGVSFQVDHERLVVRYDGGAAPTGTVWQHFDLGPLVRSVWQDFIVHIRWSSGASGSIDVWRNGRLVVSHATGANIGAGLGTYVKQGFYRPPTSSATVVYDDAMRYGKSLAEVDNPFELRFVGPIRRAKGRFWFHLRSFANTAVTVSLTNTKGQRSASSRTIETNGDGEVRSSLPCQRQCGGRKHPGRLTARADVDPGLPQETRVTVASVG